MKRLLLRRAAPVVAAAVLLGFAAIAAAAEGDFDFVDTSDFPTVRVVISPPDEATPEEVQALRVLQDGVERPAAVIALNASPLEMVLLIDSSGSMAGAAIEAAKQAAIAFVDALPTGSDVSVIAFGDDVRLVAEPGADRATLVAAIATIQADGETALHDAVTTAARLVDETVRTRQFVVLLSDGGDTTSTAGLDDVTTLLESVPMGFYAIELAGSEPDPATLAAMANATGGRVIPASDSTALAAVYADIARVVVSQYAVVFESATGGASTVEVVFVAGGSEVRLSSDLIFPAIPTDSAGPVATVPAAADRILTPPITVVSPGPSRLGEEWALRAGAVMIATTLIIIFAYALQPSGGSAKRSLLPAALVSGERRRLQRERRGDAVSTGIEKALSVESRRGIESSLEAAGIKLRAGEYLGMVAIAVIISLGIGLLADSPVLALILLAVSVMLPRALVARSARHRRARFADQLEGTLQLIAGSLRAGYGLVSAMSTVATEAPEPTAAEFGRVVIETRVGRDLTVALRAVAARMDNDDFAWVADAIAIQQEVGGNLAEVLDAVAGTIRDRNQIRRQVHALSAEGRMSAVILIGLPFVIGGVIALLNPGYLNSLWETTVGKALIFAGAVLMVVGVVWIRRIVRIIF